MIMCECCRSTKKIRHRVLSWYKSRILISVFQSLDTQLSASTPNIIYKMGTTINDVNYNKAMDYEKGTEQILVRDWSVVEEKKAKRK